MAVLTQLGPTGAPEPPFAPAAAKAGIELYWLPLGADGWLVRLNGRIFLGNLSRPGCHSGW
jgi:hypothetical protein